MNYSQFLEFIAEWHSPQRGYDITEDDKYTYGYVSPRPGVYVIVEEIGTQRPRILYVGSSKNLRNRYKSHPVFRIVKQLFANVKFYYLETSDYLKVESDLIGKLKPLLNLKG